MRLLPFFALAAGQGESESEVCLLSLNANRVRAFEGMRKEREARMDNAHSQAAAQWGMRHRELHEWSRSHAELRNALAQVAAKHGVVARVLARDGLELEKQPSDSHLTGHDIEGFIKAQNEGEEHCHAKMLEAKRTLDGVSAKVIALSDQVEAQEAIIEGETLEIKEATEKKADSDETRAEDDERCKKKHKDAIDGLDNYREELRELEQIAEPAVRSSIADHIDYGAEVKKHIESVKEEFSKTNFSASYNLSLISDASCKDLVTFLNARNKGNLSLLASKDAPVTFTALDCNATREVLQEEFTKAWTEISELIKEGENLADMDKEDCEELSKGDENDRQAKLNNQIREATRNIMSAREVLNALSDLLGNAKQEAEMLRKHLLELKDSCELEGGVGEHLTKIRELIRSLQECPGRNDFRLKVPTLPEA